MYNISVILQHTQKEKERESEQDFNVYWNNIKHKYLLCKQSSKQHKWE